MLAVEDHVYISPFETKFHLHAPSLWKGSFFQHSADIHCLHIQVLRLPPI